MEIDLNNNKSSVRNELLAVNTRKRHKKITDNFKLTLETLNMECFLMILDHLDSESMMDLCDVNAQFRAKVCSYEHIFRSKLFEIQEFVDIRPIFEDYGRFICKLDVNEYNILHERFSMKFNRLMASVTQYLVPGNLTELTLRFGVVKIDNDLFASAVPYFSNLKRFTFSACGSNDYSRAQEHVLDEIIANAHQLTSLDVRYLRTAGNWCRFSHLKQLEHFSFLFVELTSFAPFRQFIQMRPKLKTLVLSTESVHHQHICRLVTKYVPDLIVFEIRNHYMQLPHGDDFDFSPVPWTPKATPDENDDSNEENDSEEDDDEDNDNDENETTFEESGDESNFESEESDSDIDDVRDPEFVGENDHITNWKGIYAGLSGMNQLQRTWLKSHFTDCSDLYDIVEILAKKNILNYLTIQVSTLQHDPTQSEQLPTKPFPVKFAALKTLRLISPSIETEPFLYHFIQSLPNMTKCILDMENIDRSVQDTIATIVEAADNLTILGLKMPAMNLDHLLYMKLIGIKLSKMSTSNETKPLGIYISSFPQRIKCLAQLKDQYDEKIIAIKIKSFMTWENNPL